MQRLDYKETFGISQSAIKEFRLKAPSRWKELWIDRQIDLDKRDDSFLFGSLLDTMLFTPELLEERFCVSDAPNLPSKAIESIVYSFHKKANAIRISVIENNNSNELPFDEEVPSISLLNPEFQELLLQEANEFLNEEGKRGWNIGWKEATRIAKIQEQGEYYLQFLNKANGRKVISSEMNFLAIECADILRKNERVKKYFVPEKATELKFQFEIFADYPAFEGNVIPLKGALDIVRIDHENRTIQIADFKTAHTAFDFVKSIKQYDYTGQLSFYDYLLRDWLKVYCDGVYCEYEVLPPINIVIDSTIKIPYIYQYDWRDIAIAREGNSNYLFALYQTQDHNSKVRKGWIELLEEIAWHMLNNKWEMPKEMYETGVIKVNLLNS